MKHFVLDEFINSTAAQASEIYNYPPVSVIDFVYDNIYRLGDNVLDPIVDHINLPVIVSNGYCRPELYNLIGEKDSRQHLIGCAADITNPDMTARDLKELAFWCADNLDFDQLIVYSRDRYIHVSYVSPEVNRHEVLFS